MASPRGPPPLPISTPPRIRTMNLQKALIDIIKAYPDKQKYHSSIDDLDISIRQFYEMY